jgi:hypothetical protein
MNWRIIVLGALLFIMLFSGIHIAAQSPQMGQQEVIDPDVQCRDNPTVPTSRGRYGVVVPHCDDVVWDENRPPA